MIFSELTKKKLGSHFPKNIYMTNENHKSQYNLQFYMRKYNFHNKFFGYFHTSFPNNHLSLKPLIFKNKPITPIPDILLSNSKNYSKILKNYYSKKG